jgi:hypothetical protein
MKTKASLLAICLMASSPTPALCGLFYGTATEYSQSFAWCASQTVSIGQEMSCLSLHSCLYILAF